MFVLDKNQTSGHPMNSIHKQSEAESTDVRYIMIETCSVIPGLGNGRHSHGCQMRFCYILGIFISIEMLCDLKLLAFEANPFWYSGTIYFTNLNPP